jgi:hypothetical protein
MSKSLFDENFRYTEDANTICDEVFHTIQRIMNKYAGLGYSPREISNLLIGEVRDAELCSILNIDAIKETVVSKKR